MTGVSGLELVSASIRAGIGGSFPAHNAGTSKLFDEWLTVLGALGATGPIIPNLIVHRSSTRRDDDLAVVVSHRVPAVITSVGSPVDVVAPLREAGVLVLADVATVQHARRAIELGVDGLMLLTAGAGGQTGWANPFAFTRAVRAEWDGLVVLAGGIVDGQSIAAARLLGADLVAMGTRFIATEESSGGTPYADAVVAASMDDIELRSDLTGLPTNMIRSPHEHVARDASLPYDADLLEQGGSIDDARDAPRIYSAGHGAGAITTTLAIERLVARLEAELAAAMES